MSASSEKAPLTDVNPFIIGDRVPIRSHMFDDLVPTDYRKIKNCPSAQGSVYHLYGKGFIARAKCVECRYTQSVSKLKT